MYPQLRTLPMTALLSIALLFPTMVNAERSQVFGDYTVHFNAISTHLLSPDIASHYQIPRSPNQGMLTIAVLKTARDNTGKPVAASITGTATNLSAQQSQLQMREIQEGTAIYYIDSFRVSNEETLSFDLEITPIDGGMPMQLRFQQQFFVE